jgi:hypothetical protein
VGVGAGLFKISAALKAVGEPAPTGLLIMVQYLYFNKVQNNSCFFYNKPPAGVIQVQL